MIARRAMRQGRGFRTEAAEAGTSTPTVTTGRTDDQRRTSRESTVEQDGTLSHPPVDQLRGPEGENRAP